MNRARALRLLLLAALAAWPCAFSAKAEEKDGEVAAPPRLVIDAKGPTGKIWDVLFTPDGSTLISVGEDKAIYFWDVETGTLSKTLRGQIGDGHEGQINAAAISPDGRWLAIGGLLKNDPLDGPAIRLIDLETEEVVAMLWGHANVVQALAFSPDGRLLASGSHDRTIRLWEIPADLGQGAASSAIAIESKATLEGHGGQVYGVAFLPDGGRLASGGMDGFVILWDLGTGKLVKKMPGHEKAVCAIAATSDGQHLLSGGHDGKILLWNAADGTLKDTLKSGLKGQIHSLSLSPDGRRVLASAAPDGDTGVYDIPSGRQLTLFNRRHNNQVLATAWHPTKNLVASAGGDDNDIYFWTPELGMGNERVRVHRHLRGDGANCNEVAFESGSKLAVTFGRSIKDPDKKAYRALRFDFSQFTLSQAPRPGDVRAVTTFSGRTLSVDPAEPYKLNVGRNARIENDPAAQGKVLSHTWTPSGDLVIGSEFSLRWQAADGSATQDFIGHTGEVWSVAVSSDGKYLASASSDQTVRLWSLEKLQAEARAVAGARVASERGGPLRITTVFDGYPASLAGIKTGDELLTIDGKSFGHDADAVSAYVSGKKPGDRLTYEVRRGGQARRHEIVLAQYLDTEPKAKPLATLFVADNGEWICSTPRGHFTASTKGADYVRWHFNKGIDRLARSLSGDQLFTHFFRSDLVSAALGLEGAPSLEVAKAEDFDLTDALRGAPSVSILSPSPNHLASQKRQEVVVETSGPSGSRVDLFHEGKVLDPDGPGMESGGRTRYTFTVTLANGANDLRAVAVSESGVESAPQTVKVTFEGTKADARLHILAVGVNQYKNPRYNLEYCRPDIEAIVASLKLRNQGLYTGISVHELYDQQATRAAIEAKFREIAGVAEPEDVFVFAYAGHGSMDTGAGGRQEFYLLPHETTEMYEDLADFAVSGTALRDFSASIKARKQLTLLDACQSGAAVETFAMRGVAEEKAIAQLSRSTGMYVMASTRSEHFAAEAAELKHGIFTFALLEALEGAGDSNQDGTITVNEIKTRLDEQVPQLSEKHIGTAQYPYSFGKGQDFPLGVAAPKSAPGA